MSCLCGQCACFKKRFSDYFWTLSSATTSASQVFSVYFIVCAGWGQGRRCCCCWVCVCFFLLFYDGRNNDSCLVLGISTAVASGFPSANRTTYYASGENGCGGGAARRGGGGGILKECALSEKWRTSSVFGVWRYYTRIGTAKTWKMLWHDRSVL